jgi:hypothetical protein
VSSSDDRPRSTISLQAVPETSAPREIRQHRTRNRDPSCGSDSRAPAKGVPMIG